MISLRRGCPIRISLDQNLLAVPQSFSQRATSFVASWCQGIHRMPFCRSIQYLSPTKLERDFANLPAMHRNHSSEPQNHYRRRCKKPPLGTEETCNTNHKNPEKSPMQGQEFHAALAVITTAAAASSYI